MTAPQPMNAGKSPTPNTDTMKFQVSELDQEISRVSMVRDQLGGIADMLGGSQPQSPNKAAAPALIARSMVDSLQGKRIALAALLDGCDIEIDRITKALGAGA